MLIIELIHNLALLVAISVLSGIVTRYTPNKPRNRQLLHGLLFGLAAVAGILDPVVLTEGLFFDGRSVVISISTLFFGPVSGFVTALLPFILRAWIGGPGMYMGLSVILASYLIGWYFHRENSKQKIPSPFTIYSMGLIVHAVMILTIYLLPAESWQTTLQTTGATIILIYPVITLIMGTIIADQESNHRMILELKERERLFRTTFYSIADAVVTTDSQGRIRQINAEAARLSGMAEEEVVGKEVSEMLSLLDENTGLPLAHPIYAVLDGIDRTESKSYLLKQKNGETIPVADSVAAIRAADQSLLGAVFVFRDRRPEIARLDALLRSAESYTNLFNNIGGAAYVQDRQGRFIDVNEGAVKLYGYPKSFFIGKTPAILSAPGKNDLGRLIDHIDAAFRGEACTFEFWGKKADGSIFPKEVHLFKTTYNNEEAVFALAYDISERRKAQQELQAIQERYQTLFNASPVGIILEDLDGFILDVNETVCSDYGFERKELVGSHIGILVSDKVKPDIAENISRIKTDKFLSTRVDSLTKDGVPKVFELIETLIILPDGRQGILSISKNITEQVKAEQTLIVSEARNKAILLAIPDLFFRFGRDGSIIDYFAPDTSELLVKPEDFMGKNLAELLPPELKEVTFEFIQKALEQDSLQQLEYSMKLPSGHEWFEARMVRSGPEEVLAIIRNVSERKKAEIAIEHQKQFIETLLESIPNPLFYMDTNGIYLGVNKAYRDLYKIEAADIIGKNLYETETEDRARLFREADARIFSGTDKVQVFERTILLPNGQSREVILTKSPFPDAQGGIGGLIAMITDISSRKAMETDLKKAKEKAEESDKLKTSFLNNMNHEIRTPLNAIVGFSDLLFEDYTEEEKRSFVLTINNNAEQLLRIIDDVLAVSRLDAEHLPLETELTDLQDLLKDLERTFTPHFERKQLNLQLEMHPLPDHVLVDKVKIRQVMTGFLENAFKYTLEGGVVFGCKAEDNKLNFFVRDSGIGIPEDEKPFVFDRFFRGSEAQSKAMRGNGLGLSISKGLVEIMGGKIQLESSVGVGSVFSFLIPCVVSGHPPKDEVIYEHPQSDWFKDLSLLIADDEADNLDLLFAILLPYFGEIATARNGSEVIQLMESKAFDIVLMDIKMPVMDGYEATAIIRQRFPDTIVIGQTAYSQPEEIQRIIAVGAHACLVKPIESERLFSILREAAANLKQG